MYFDEDNLNDLIKYRNIQTVLKFICFIALKVEACIIINLLIILKYVFETSVE